MMSGVGTRRRFVRDYKRKAERNDGQLEKIKVM